MIFPRSDNFFLDPQNPNRRQFMFAYQDLFITPYNWTILHILAFCEPETIPSIAIYPEFKVSFLLDKYEKTPLHYIVASNPIDYLAMNVMLTYICGYLEDKKHCSSYECQKVLESLTTLFLFLTSKADVKVAEKYLNVCFLNSPTRYNEVKPNFGQPQTKVAFSKTPVILPEVKEQIYEPGDSHITFKSAIVKLDYDVKSDDMSKTASVLSKLEEERIFSASFIAFLINYLWEKVRLTLAILGTLFSVIMILISIYIGISERNLFLEIPIIILTIIFLMGETIQAFAMGSHYYRNIWNCVDLSTLFLILLYVIKQITYTELEDDNINAWMASLIIFFGYARWVSFLRLFDPTRNLIQVILSIFHDMMGFITVVAFITVGFSVIFLEFSHRNSEEDEGYVLRIYRTCMIMFGNTDDTDYNTSERIILSVILFILNILLLNMLISIIGSTFARVQETKVLTDSLTRLDMILEALVFMRIFKRKYETGTGYLIFCSSEVTKEGEIFSTQEGKFDEKPTKETKLQRDIP